MPAMNWNEIARVVGELQAFSGASLSRAHMPDGETLLLDLRAQGRNHLLLINVGDDRTRLHFVAERPANPPNPYAFMMLLRSRLEPARLAGISQPEGERLVRFDFLAPQENGESLAYALVAELTGRHANVLLLDAEGTILGSLRPNRSEKRRLATGARYAPPTPLPLKLMPIRYAPGDGPFPENAGVAAHFGGLAETDRREMLFREAQRELKKRLDKAERVTAALQNDLAEARQADRFRHWGDLLRTYYPRLKRGLAEIVVDDILADSGASATIPLDPRLSPEENIAACYRRAKKGQRGQPILEARLAEQDEIRDRLLRLAELLDERTEEAVAKVRAALGLDIENPAEPKAVREAFIRALPYRRYVSASGREIRVGKNAAANDVLTWRHTKGEDFWFHASAHAGSHVVVPMARDAELDAETLLDAATLAAHHSKAKGEAEVIYCRARQLRKPRKAPPGRVLVSGHKTMRVVVDPLRLKRLKASAKPEG